MVINLEYFLCSAFVQFQTTQWHITIHWWEAFLENVDIFFSAKFPFQPRFQQNLHVIQNNLNSPWVDLSITAHLLFSRFQRKCCITLISMTHPWQPITPKIVWHDISRTFEQYRGTPVFNEQTWHCIVIYAKQTYLAGELGKFRTKGALVNKLKGKF